MHQTVFTFTCCVWKAHLTTEHIPLQDSVEVRSVNSFILALLLPLVKNTRNEQMYYWGYPPRWVSEVYHLQLITSFC